MSATRNAILAALLAPTPAAVAAQATDRSGHLDVHAAAGAAIPGGAALTRFDPGWVAMLGLRLPLPDAGPLDFQLDVLHARLTDEPYEVPLPADGYADVEPRASVTALGASLVLAPRASARVRPYLVGGGGFYHLTRNDRATAPDATVASGSRSAPGVSVGGGFELRLGRVVPFAEVRYHTIFLDGGGDVVTDENTHLVPLVVGIRF